MIFLLRFFYLNHYLINYFKISLWISLSHDTTPSTRGHNLMGCQLELSSKIDNEPNERICIGIRSCTAKTAAGSAESIYNIIKRCDLFSGPVKSSDFVSRNLIATMSDRNRNHLFEVFGVFNYYKIAFWCIVLRFWDEGLRIEFKCISF